MMRILPEDSCAGSLRRREITAASDIDRLPDHRKIQIESRAFLRRTLYPNFAGMFLDDPVGHRKAKSGAPLLAVGRRSFGGEEWIVDALNVFLRDSASSVGHY